MLPVILAAGRGSRLKELTNDNPKPFVYIKAEKCSLLEKMLSNLLAIGFKEAVIVVGYLKEYFYNNLGSNYRGLKINYVPVDDWEKSNNSCSLYAAKNYISDDFLIIEADEYFHRPFILPEHLNDDNNYWLGVSKPITGCLLFGDSDNNLINLEIVRDPEALKNLNGFFKSCGVVNIAKKDKASFFEDLEKFLTVEANRQKYFDLFIKENLNKFKVKILPLPADLLWTEIDDINDLNDLENQLTNQLINQ